MKPALGRSFSAEDCGWNAPGTVVLSDETWRRRFGADPNVVGTTLTLNDHPTTVIGVAPATFDFGDVFYPGNHVDVYLPMPLSPEMNQFGNLYGVIGRLKPDATVESARAELTTIADRLTKEHPDRNGFRAVVASLDEHITGRLRSALLVLAWSVVLVMLIVWANVGSLQMARSVARRKETAVRAAIGAGRWRLIRQTLTESMLLAGCGTLMGVGLAVAGTRALASLNVFNLPALSTVHVDERALVFAVLVALVTGILFGVAPAL